MRLIQTVKDLISLEKYLSDKEVLVLDTETSSLYPWRDGRILAGLGVKALGDSYSFYIPVRHKDSVNIPLAEFISFCYGLLEKTLVFHNANYDLAVLWQEGVNLLSTNVFDTVVMWRLVSEDEPNYQLKRLAKKYINDEANVPEKELKKYIKKNKLQNYGEVPADIIAPYVEGDVVYTDWLYSHAMPKIEERGLSELLELEKEVGKSLFFLEKDGFLIDQAYVTKRYDYLVKKEKTLEKACFHYMVENLPDGSEGLELFQSETKMKAANSINLDSAHHLKTVFHSLGINSSVLTEKQNESWDKNALAVVDHPLAHIVLARRAVRKLKDFYENIIELADSNNVVHCSIHQAGAKTGRMSCVPLNTEILTKHGWKRWDELILGEEVIGYDIKNKLLTFTNLLGIHRERSQIGELKFRTITTKTRKKIRGVVCTPDHLWVAEAHNIVGFIQAKDMGIRKREQVRKLIVSSKSNDFSGSSLCTKEEAALIGWAVTDGFIRNKNSSSQNRSLEIQVRKPSSINALDELLKGNFNYTRSFYEKKNVVRFYIGTCAFKKLWEKAKLDYQSLTEFVIQLDNQAREYMYDAMMEADGAWKRNVFGASKQEVRDAFLALCVLLGKATTYRLYKPGLSKQIFSEINVLVSDGIHTPKFIPFNQEEEVWCPKTGTGTWVLRQEGVVSITGNCTSPNLQQLPSVGKMMQRYDQEFLSRIGSKLLSKKDLEKLVDVRGSFIARPGHFLLFADFMQQELRVLADYADEEGLIKAFSYGFDAHSMTARTLRGELPEDADDSYKKWWRGQGKDFNFGLLYGLGLDRISALLGSTTREAKQFRDRYFTRFPNVLVINEQTRRSWNQRSILMCSSHGEFCTNQDCEYDLIGWVKNKWGRRRYFNEQDQYKIVNFLVQGSSADQTKDVFIRLDKILLDYKSSIKLIVHDEFIFEISYKEAEKVIPIIVTEMRTCDKLNVPMDVELKWSPNRWSNAISLSCDECNGIGKTFNFEQEVLFTAVYNNDGKLLDRVIALPCNYCLGKGYDLGKIKQW